MTFRFVIKSVVDKNKKLDDRNIVKQRTPVNPRISGESGRRWQ